MEWKANISSRKAKPTIEVTSHISQVNKANYRSLNDLINDVYQGGTLDQLEIRKRKNIGDELGIEETTVSPKRTARTTGEKLIIKQLADTKINEIENNMRNAENERRANEYEKNIQKRVKEELEKTKIKDET